MLSDHQRRLEIGSHRERLDTVKELGAMDNREAYALLQLAADDIDPQIRETAERLMRESVWDSGAGSTSRNTTPEEEEQEPLF